MGQYFNVTHDLNTTEVFVDITGKQTLADGEHQRNLGGTTHIPGWSRTLTTQEYWKPSLVHTSEGYALVGMGGVDGWYSFDLIKTDSFGNIIWNSRFWPEFPDYSEPNSLVQTSDGGYAIAGTLQYLSPSDADVWLVKTDWLGDEEWNQTYGGTDYDYGRSVVRTSGGGYAVAGIGREQWNTTKPRTLFTSRPCLDTRTSTTP